MKRWRNALLLVAIGPVLSGCYAYAGPPRHARERVVVVHERPKPKRVVVREKVVVKESKHRHKHHHHHDD